MALDRISDDLSKTCDNFCPCDVICRATMRTYLSIYIWASPSIHCDYGGVPRRQSKWVSKSKELPAQQQHPRLNIKHMLEDTCKASRYRLCAALRCAVLVAEKHMP
jgi:hypothetical protein